MESIEKVRRYLANLDDLGALPAWCRRHGLVNVTAYRFARGNGNPTEKTIKAYDLAIKADKAKEAG